MGRKDGKSTKVIDYQGTEVIKECEAIKRVDFLKGEFSRDLT